MLQRIATQSGALVLTVVLIAGCGGTTAAPVNVEGTVQARVSATVGAATRAQASPTRPAANTPVAISTSTAASPAAGSASATTIASGTAAATGAAGAATATRPASSPPPVAGAPAAATAAAGAVVPVATGGASATSGATPGAATARLPLGTYARFGGFSVTVSRYEWGPTCPSGSGRPAAGAKFVTLQIAGRNDLGTALSLPAVQWTFEGHQAVSGAQLPCQPDEQALANACYGTGVLPAGGRCQGWVLFEVPETLDVPGGTVQARSPVSAAETAVWRLPG